MAIVASICLLIKWRHKIRAGASIRQVSVSCGSKKCPKLKTLTSTIEVRESKKGVKVTVTV